jgi:hypothetical protein
MHATIEQLLTIRDREPVTTAVKQHADNCPTCGDRLSDLALTQRELQRLPAQSPPRDYWPDILSRLEHERRAAGRRRRLARYGGLGVAASMLLAAALFVYTAQNEPGSPGRLPDSAATPASGSPDRWDVASNPVIDADDQAVAGPSAAVPDLETLIARSAQLEAILHALPERPRVIRAGTADLIIGLQDGVALIDYQLNVDAGDPLSPAALQLWQQRVDLMNSLVNVRYAEMQRVAYTPN